MQNEQHISSDILGIIASTACALHCSVLPLLLAMGSFTSIAWMENEWVEVLFLLSAIVFASWSIVPKFWRDRSDALPIILMAVGLCLLIAGAIHHTHDGHIRIISVIGGVLLATAHFLNFRQSTPSCAL